ncbi:MAG: phenylalanine--tRNA ligase subunit beta [Betaproteobacteria bacterium RBG_16_64_18]|nr:MAG: phenylalanine--tRNA ligase subunit beta [Betaproteobacteria bacterium RBG_16_64_18]
MQFSERWLRTLVDPSLSADELCHLLTMSGLEIETCAPVAPPFSGVVVAQMLAVAKHPNADRLTVCSVDAGTGAPLSIVCGAPNVAAGMKVPCALVGARLPGESPDRPFEIKPATMRGVQSQGMLCSARELGLSDDHSGLLALPANAPVGRDFRDFYELDDRLITVKLTPNRADCLSVLGVAREVAALTRAKLAPPPVAPVAPAIEETFPVSITDPQGCGRFTGRVIRNVDAGAPTPEWMKRRLERAGQRAISALVDVTNYVMLELGRPLHVYDLDKVRGGIDVRFGRKGESVKLLNEQTVAVDEDVLCITDDSGPIGLAGIMGGEGTKADLETRHVFLESAFFFPNVIAGRSRRYNFSSDAAHRFERGVDFDNNVAGIERATRLILDICGGQAGPVEDLVARLPERRPVMLRVARAHKVIGVVVPADEISDIFHRLGFESAREGAGANEVFVVTPPSFRFDIEIEEDLIEEVARVHGFERIPAHPPAAPALMRAEPERRRSLHDVRHQLAASDYHEVINFSFVEEAWEADFAGNADPIRLLNPIASQLAVMRSSLIGSLVANLRHNLNRKIARIRVFEIGRVYLRDPATKDGDRDVAGVRQPVRVGAIACGPALDEQWGERARAVDFFDIKGDLEALLAPLRARFEPAVHPHPALHPGRAARVMLGGTPIGWVGELHPRWQQKYELSAAPVLFELDAAPILALELPRYSEVSRFPPVVRDLAVVVSESAPAQALLDELEASRPAVVQDIRLFDVYQGKGIPAGQKSLAFRVVMQDTAKTLTDGEADAAMAQLIRSLAAKFGARLRA